MMRIPVDPLLASVCLWVSHPMWSGMFPHWAFESLEYLLFQKCNNMNENIIQKCHSAPSSLCRSPLMIRSGMQVRFQAKTKLKQNIPYPLGLDRVSLEHQNPFPLHSTPGAATERKNIPMVCGLDAHLRTTVRILLWCCVWCINGTGPRKKAETPS